MVGAGFAGLYAAMGLRRLARAGHRVTVVNPENFMQYQPFLPEVASGTIDPRAVVVPLRPVLRHCEVRGRRGEARRSRRADRGRRAWPGARERPWPTTSLVLARRLHVPGPADPRTGRARGGVQDRPGGHLPAQPSPVTARRRRRGARTPSGAARRSRSSSSAGDMRASRRSASSRTWRGTRSASYPTIDAGDMRWVLVDAAGKILPELGEDLAELRDERAERAGDPGAARTRGSSRIEDGVVRLSDGRVLRRPTPSCGRRACGPHRSRGTPASRSTATAGYGPTSTCGSRGSRTRGRPATPPPSRTRRPAGSCRRRRSTGCARARRLARNLVAVARGRPARAVRVPEHRGGVLARPLQGGRPIWGIKLRGFPAWFAHR